MRARAPQLTRFGPLCASAGERRRVEKPRAPLRPALLRPDLPREPAAEPPHVVAVITDARRHDCRFHDCRFHDCHASVCARPAPGNMSATAPHAHSMTRGAPDGHIFGMRSCPASICESRANMLGSPGQTFGLPGKHSRDSRANTRCGFMICLCRSMRASRAGQRERDRRDRAP